MTVRVASLARFLVPAGPSHEPTQYEAWSEVLEALAAEQALRRSAEVTTRWPLGHRCSRPPRANSAAQGTSDTGAATPTPSCCRALA